MRGVAVGPQYDSTHVYVAPGDMDAFVTSFMATFGGQTSKRIATMFCPSRAALNFNMYGHRLERFLSSRFKHRFHFRLGRNALDTWSPTWARQLNLLVPQERT